MKTKQQGAGQYPFQRVVVVDDHPAVCDGIQDLLSTKSSLVFSGSASTLREAYELIDFEKPDIVVLDLSLPDGDGFELVRSYGHTQRPAIVIYSMYGTELIRNSYYSPFVHSVVSKTAPADGLLKTLERVAWEITQKKVN